MQQLEEVKHPAYVLYRDLDTGHLYTLAADDDGEVELVDAEELLAEYQEKQERLARQKALLAVETPKLVQIPRYPESRVAATSRAMQVYTPLEEETPSPDIVGTTVSRISKLPLEFRIALAVIGVLFVCSLLVVPVAPKIIQIITHSAPPPAVSSSKYTDRLTRIAQLDQSQYDSLAQYNAYSPSACSAAALTGALDSFGANWKISTILDEEISLGAITPSQGLVDINGISNTAAHFGFVATPVSGLDQAIQIANSGTPVIVDIVPGSAWPGGHFVDVKGGDSSSVRLIDSWSTNFQTITRQRFLSWGIGKMFSITPGKYTILQNPTLTADQVNKVLAANGSPAAGSGQSIVDLSNQYHIDDSYILATFFHESTWGKNGVARESKSPGNLRCAAWLTWGWCDGGYTYFKNWGDGFRALYMLLAGSHYVGAGLTTPDMIIPSYAPNSDNNNEAGYITALKWSIDSLRAGKTQF